MYKLLTNKDLKNLKIKHYKKDAVLFHENDICRNIGILKDGEIVIKSYTNKGKEIIYNTIKSGELFGNNLLFSDNKQYLGDVIALKDCEVLYIDTNELFQIFKNNKTFLKAYLTKEANITKNLNMKIKLLSLNTLEEKFYYYLNYHNNKIKIESITSFAKELSVQRETLSRLLSKLIKEKKIIRKDKTIKLL